MSDSKIEKLREKICDELDKLLIESYEHFSSRDLLEVVIERTFSGYKGISNMTNEELLEVFNDEIDNIYEVEEEAADAADKLRTLAAEFEMELVAEKELLSE